MRHLAKLIAIAILATGYASAQTTTNGALKLSSVVVTNEQDLVALAAVSNLNTRAWQNSASATNFTWTSDDNEITITDYNLAAGGPNVVIPDLINGKPVTGFGTTFSRYDEGMDDYVVKNIQSVTGGNNIKIIPGRSFMKVATLKRVALNSVTNIAGEASFYGCLQLEKIEFKSLISITGEEAFSDCPALQNIEMPATIKELGTATFRIYDEAKPLNIYFYGDAPSLGAGVYSTLRTPVTNYVANPTATGWGATFGDRPVVRLPIYGTPVDGLTAATVTNIVRATSLSSQTWTAAGTNATYQLTWDITNKTFKVLEILP